MTLPLDQIERLSEITSHSQVFNGVDLESLKALVKMGSVVSVKSGDLIIEEEKRVPGLFVLLEGAVSVIKNSKPVFTFGRGSFFGEISLFGVSFAGTATVQAREPAKLLMVTREVLETWAKHHPEAERIFLRKMCTELSRRLYSTSERL